MATPLDVPLDDLIKSRAGRGTGRGRGQGGGRGRGDGQRLARGSWRGRGTGNFRERGLGVSSRRPLGVNTWSSSFAIAKSFNKAKDFVWRHDLFEDSMVAAGLSGIESGTKLYISNLHYGVTSEDLQELFSEMGHLKHCAVHYDSYRHPTGSAEVIFTRRSEALAALKRYNNMRLDGKAMKIEVIGAELGLSAAAVPQISVVPGASRRGQREVVMMPGGSGFGQGASGPSSSLPGWKRGGFVRRGQGRVSFPQRGRGQVRSRGRGRGRSSFVQSRGRGYVRRGNAEKSAKQLDKELDNYNSGVMNVD